MPDPEITVLMAVYNGQDYLSETIESIRNQTFRDFEFLIVDDSSNDQTSEILQRAAAEDSRLRIICNDKNLGLTRSLNIGLRAASGSLVARIDADDVAVPSRLSEQVAYLRAHPDCAVLSSAAYPINEHEEATEGTGGSYTSDQILGTILIRNPIIHSSVMYHRKSILELGGYDERYSRAQDYDLWLRCIYTGLRIDSLPSELIGYRFHKNRISLRQSEVVEDCRSAMLSHAWANILGIRVRPGDSTLIEQLRLWQLQPELVPNREVIAMLRRLRTAFAHRFFANTAALQTMDSELIRLVENLGILRVRDVSAEKTYVAGGSAIRYRLTQIRRILSFGINRSRFRLGALRKWLTKTACG